MTNPQQKAWNKKRAGKLALARSLKNNSDSAYMWAIMLSPKAEHLISVAPSIKRAKS